MGNEHLLHLTYEDDVKGDPKVAYSNICDFIGVEEEPAEVTLKKSNPYPLNRILVNYDEVARQLKDSPYEWMLHS